MGACAICRHARRLEIEAAVASRADPLKVAQQFRVSLAQLRKHESCAPVAGRAGVTTSVPGHPPAGSAGVAPVRLAPACAVCAHPQRAAIELALGAGRQSAPAVARKFLLDVEAVRRHRKLEHRELVDAPRALASAPKAAPPANDDLGRGELGENASALTRARAQTNRLQALRRELEVAREEALERGEFYDVTQILKAEAAEGEAIQRYARLTGEIGPADEKRLIGTPQFQRVMGAIVEELQPHPELARRVAERLARIDTGVAA